MADRRDRFDFIKTGRVVECTDNPDRPLDLFGSGGDFERKASLVNLDTEMNGLDRPVLESIRKRICCLASSYVTLAESD